MENRMSGTGGSAELSPLGAVNSRPEDQQLHPMPLQKTGELIDQARDGIKTQVLERKKHFVGELDSVSQTLRQTGERLHEENHGVAGQYVEMAADQMQRVSGYLQARNPDQLVGEVESFARRQSGLFLAGAFGLGFLATRFLKSSHPVEGGTERRYDA